MIIDFVLGIGHSGGIENMVNLLAGYLVDRKMQNVRIIQLIDSGRKWVEKGITYEILSSGTSIDANVSRRYKEYMDTEGYPDLIVATGWPVLCKFIRATINNIDIPMIYWPHGSISVYGKFGNIGDIDSADSYIAMNDLIAEEIDLKYPDKMIHRIDNAINLNSIEFRKNRNPHHLAYVGRLDLNKNVKHIIENMVVLPEDYIFSIVGDGEEMENLYKYSNALNLASRVRFYGWKDFPWECIDDAGMLVMASHSEGFSLTLVEALARGMSVASTPVGAAEYVIEQCVNGYLYTLDNKYELANTLINIDIGAVPRVDAEECRKSVEKYDINVVGETFYNVFMELADGVDNGNNTNI